jgi:hypothetical protein
MIAGCLLLSLIAPSRILGVNYTIHGSHRKRFIILKFYPHTYHLLYNIIAGLRRKLLHPAFPILSNTRMEKRHSYRCYQNL